jgi:hypothetical protein
MHLLCIWPVGEPLSHNAPPVVLETSPRKPGWVKHTFRCIYDEYGYGYELLGTASSEDGLFSAAHGTSKCDACVNVVESVQSHWRLVAA